MTFEDIRKELRKEHDQIVNEILELKEEMYKRFRVNLFGIKPKYNSVLRSDKQIYIDKNNLLVMSFQKIFEKTPSVLVSSLLKPKEKKRLQSLIDNGNYPLVAIVKKDDNESFCGYYPLTAGIDEDKTVHRTKEGLDVLENFCGGG